MRQGGWAEVGSFDAMQYTSRGTTTKDRSNAPVCWEHLLCFARNDKVALVVIVLGFKNIGNKETDGRRESAYWWPQDAAIPPMFKDHQSQE